MGDAMIPMRSPVTERETCGVNMILLSDGREMHLDDIATATEGQAILDDVDGAIDRIEVHLDSAKNGFSPNDPDWRRRAEIALKRKRRQRPRLQQRIGELRRAERRPTPPDPGAPSRKDGRRHAFVEAAEAMLDHEVFVEVWERAREMHPDAFSTQAGEVAA